MIRPTQKGPILRTILCLSVLLPGLFCFAADAAQRAPRHHWPEHYRNKPIAEGSLVWYCAYNRHSAIRCLLGDAGARSTAPADPSDAIAATVAQRIIETPETLADEIIEIPLHTPAFDFDFVGQLAESQMCGERDDCGIIFGRNPTELAQLVRQYLAQRLSLPGAVPPRRP